MRATIAQSLVVLACAACGDNNNHNTQDAGPDAQPAGCTTSTNSGMGVLQDFCEPGDPGPNAFLLSASGEVLAITGYRFPPVNPGDFALVDGWDITYTNVISTFDKVRLSNAPDTSCTDQSMIGSDVAEITGPWALDLHKGGSLVGKEGPPEQAAPIAEIKNQNLAGGAAFDPSTRYAFSFDIVPATTTAKNVNLDAADLTLYQEMITRGCTTMLVGQAVWNGDQVVGGCTQTTVVPPYNFAVIPKTVNFHLCLPASTSYINAQNPENDPATPCGDEEHQRGVHTVKNQPTVLQATFHIDHVLWESFVHDSPAHFDSYAANVAGMSGTPTITFDDFKGKSFAPFVDAQSHQVPWRNCLGADYTPPGTGAMTFDTNGIPVNPSGTCDAQGCPAIRDFYDYTLYNHSTFGHLNADGLAFVQHHYPSP